MKFGVNLINFGPGANPESLTRSVNLVEAIGYHLIMSSDHIAVTPDVSSRYPAPFYEPLTTMGWLAATTRSMEIGTTVAILPYRSPLEIARAGANVDQLSGGRFILGVGVGWAEQEFDALNVPFRQRGAITDDYLAAIKALWTQDVASYEGRYVSFTDVDTAARPVREPHPPIWVGGASDGALRRTVRYGDGWHPIRIRVSEFRDREITRLP
ncbi:MAG: TIGR03619 family F420-dependent LLM class oxidoreductase, partial [Dehalococcoidia bacterium]|nr:TIGR03619 family F420-dependent LLM class oxidoreductase [Dehalococcoidia bacterium]